MKKPANIHFEIDDPVLKHLLSEQVTQNSFLMSDVNLPADFFVIEADQEPRFKNGTTPYLSIPKNPVRLGDIMDRLKYHLSGRERHVDDDQMINLGDFTLNPGKNWLIHAVSGATIHLTDKERLFLRVLYEADNFRCARSTLLREVWGYADGAETHTVETHIYRLRQKLETHGGQGLIKSDGDGAYYLDIKSGP